ncbi:hypothetical protein MRX96_056482, partial [Rhipicephalus microplus]
QADARGPVIREAWRAAAANNVVVHVPPQPAECWIEITELGALPPPATSVREPLFAHIPQELGTKLVVIGGHVALESSEPFECGLRAEPNAEPGPSVVAASPRQEQSLVNRNARTAFDSRNETPLGLSGVTRASPRRSATSTRSVGRCS